MQRLAFFLSLANSISFVVALVLLFVLTVHLWHVAALTRGQHGKRTTIPVELGAVLNGLVSIGIWLYVDMVGVVITRATVWYWRRVGVGGAGGPMNAAQTELMLVGAVLMVVGTIGITYAVSHRTLGNWPWVLSVAGVISTVVFYLVA